MQALHTKVDGIGTELRGHYRDDADGFADVHGAVSDLRERVAKVETNDARDAQDRVNGTGRHQVVPERGDVREIVIPTPPHGVPVNIRIGKQTHSTPPVVSWFVKSIGKAASSGIGKAVGALALIGVGVLGHHVAQPVGETKIVTVEVPAPQPPPAPVATVPVVNYTPAASASSTPDAGRRH